MVMKVMEDDEERDGLFGVWRWCGYVVWMMGRRKEVRQSWVVVGRDGGDDDSG